MLTEVFDTLHLDLLTSLDGVDPYGIVKRLLLNERAKDSPEDLFRLLGFVHLYTASGIHIYAFLDALDGLGRRFSPKSATKILWFQKFIRASGIGLIFFAWGLQQFRIGFLRPIFVYCLKRIFEFFGFRFRMLSPLLILLGVELLVSAISGPDFTRKLTFGRAHYFLAVSGGLFGYSWAKSTGLPGLVVHGAMALASWLATAMLDLFVLGQIAFLTPVISLLTIPILAQATYPALLLFSLTWQEGLRALSYLMNQSAGWIAGLVDWVGGVFVVPPLAPILAIPVTGLFYLLFRAGRKILSIVSLMVSILCATFLVHRIERSEVTLLNVGQGDSVLSVGNGRAELIDTGIVGALKDRAWIDILTKRGVTKIDGVLFSHWDEDHVGAFRQLIRLVPVGCVQIHSEAWDEDKGKVWMEWFQGHPEVKVTSQGCIQTGEVKQWSVAAKGKKAGNNRMQSFTRSLTPELQFVNFGDASKILEEQLVATLPKDVPTLWKVNHHGSHTSTPFHLGDQLKIQEFWISAGRRNRYGHPHQSVVKLLESWGVPIRRTTDPTPPHYYKWQWREAAPSLDLWDEIRLGLGRSRISDSDS